MKIKSITEAFSMQPASLMVVDEKYRSKTHPEGDIKEIKEGNKQVSTDKLISVYVGYNFNGEKLFEYIAESVNVHFY